MKLKPITLLIPFTIITLSACNSGNNGSMPSLQSKNITNKAIEKQSYQLIIDAGSSGSRVYVYSKQESSSIPMLNDLYEKKTSLPLASFANNPRNAGSSIEPLLESAIAYLNTHDTNLDLSSISTNILGTAGMRVIPESQQSEIYKNVSETILNKGLKLGQTKTITGQEEGIYSWVDINYLNNNFNKSATSGIFEVGGASTQVAFATSQALSESVIEVRIKNQKYNVFSTSFLGLGQDYARGLMNQDAEHNQCYPSGYTFTGINAPYFFDDLSIDGSFSLNSCSQSYDKIINSSSNMNKINEVTDFYDNKFIGVSSAYYALNFWNIENNPSELTSNIEKTCNQSYSQMKLDHPNAFELQNQCANSVLINNMMFKNLKFEPNQIYATKSINETPLSWTLGFAVIN